jgi:ketosteroid isomerase-like protein
MRSWLAMRLVGHSMAALRAGNVEPSLRMDAPDVVMHFPGDSSWSGEVRGKDAHGAWLARFARVGLQIHPDEVVVAGWRPWHLRLLVRGHINLPGSDGVPVYENRFVMWCVLRWGRLFEYEIYEDTQKSAALDGYLASHEPAP